MKLKIIYETRGKAKEYAPYGLTIYKGCDFGCTYCSVPLTKKVDRELFKSDVSVAKEDFLSKVEKDCKKLKGTDREVLISFTSDPYNDLNEYTRLTRDVLKLFRTYSIPFTVLTKGGLRAVRDFDLYTEKDSFATTLTFLDEVLSKKWEPNAPIPKDRIESLRLAKERNIQTWVSLEPVINPTETLELINETAEYVDLYKIGKLNYNKEVEDTVDWLKFVNDVELLLRSLGKEYILKDSLKDIKFKNI